jgi:hypothetical protein
MTIALTQPELPSSPAGDLTLFSDTLLGGKPNSDQRVFSNADHSFAVELDLIVESSAGNVSGDYSQVRDAARGRVSTVHESSMPPIGDRANQYVGATNDGKSISTITFVRGDVICAVLVAAAGGLVVDPTYASNVASAQDQKIQNH